MITLLALAAHAAEPQIDAVAGQGLTVTSADGDFAVNLRARAQLREALAVASPDEQGARDVALATQLSTFRLWLGGHVLSPRTKYLLQVALGPRDFRDGATSPVYDAYFDLAAHRDLSVRVGQIFVPFDRLRTIREYALQLPDRPRVVSELTLDRDLGVYAYSDHFGGDASPVAYRLGVFGGDGIHQLTPHTPAALVVGRVELRPLGAVEDDLEGDLARSASPGLALGLAGAVNAGSRRARSTTSTTWTGASTTYVHLAADAVFEWRGVSVEGEVVLREAAADTLDAFDAAGAPTTVYTRSGWGAVGQASAMLGDRDEVVARYGRLTAAPGTDPALIADVAAHGNEVAVGANHYLNGHKLKVQWGATALFGDDAPGDAELSSALLVDATF